MIQVSFLRPIDQFNGIRRLLGELKETFEKPELDTLLLSIAFAKSGPLLRLAASIDSWRDQGKVIKAIFGIDLQGTSKQALEFALRSFDEVYVIHSTSNATFHPKLYFFYGENKAISYYGSHNLTVGGTEINFEGGTRIEMDRPEDEATFQEALSCWTSLLPDECPMTLRLDEDLIEKLLDQEFIFDEAKTKPRQPRAVETSADGSSEDVSSKEEVAKPVLFPRTYPKPPSPLPKAVFEKTATPKTKIPAIPSTVAPTSKTRAAPPIPIAPITVVSEALAIQIVPHHNGEVFLSKIAVNQNAEFFGFPFMGMTTPKKNHNSSYPQRVPDPVVNVTVYDSDGNPSYSIREFNLNTVFYAPKAEIRVTFSTELKNAVEDYSIMVMRQTEEAHDYDIDIFNPGSDRYDEYLAVCNQTLPSGGSPRSRRMGWL